MSGNHNENQKAPGGNTMSNDPWIHRSDPHGECAAEIHNLCHEVEFNRELLAWAYGKLHDRTFSRMDDALNLDRIKMYLEHGVAS